MTKPIAWLCELAQEDGSVKTQIVTEDPEGLRWNDSGEPSPFRVTPLVAAPTEAASAEQVPAAWRVEYGAVGLPEGHPSRITGVAFYETEAEALVAVDEMDFNSTVSPLYLPQSQPAAAVPDGLADALRRIAAWDEHPASLGVDFGSNGVRDYYRRVALDALAAAPQAPQQAEPWRPIETAPKDAVVLLAAEFDCPGDWRIKCGTWIPEEKAWRVWGASWIPTRWMPLPAPPTTPAG